MRMDFLFGKRYALAMAEEKPKDPAAQSMAEKRWAKTTPKQRSAYATKMAEARWGKKRAKPAKKPAAKRKPA